MQMSLMEVPASCCLYYRYCSVHKPGGGQPVSLQYTYLSIFSRVFTFRRQSGGLGSEGNGRRSVGVCAVSDGGK